MNRRLVISALGCTLALAPLAARALPADASAIARQLVRWATDTGDHQGLPFAVIDKPWARIHVFSARGQWLGSAPVLLGAAQPVHILTPSATVRRIVNMTALTVADANAQR